MTSLMFSSSEEMDQILHQADLIFLNTPYSFLYIVINEKILSKNYDPN